MAVVPIQFPVPTEAVIASFNYTDIAEGTGKIIYFGHSSEDSSAVDYHLNTTKVFSSQETTKRTTAGTTTLDFDLPPLNLPLTAKGTCFFSTGISSASGATTKLQVQVKKFDGSTETNISSEITTPTAGGNTKEIVVILIPLTQTLIKIGEILRLTVKLVSTGSANAFVGHDPTNRGTDIPDPVTETMEFHMSFRIDT